MDSQDRVLLAGVAGFVLAIALVGVLSYPAVTYLTASEVIQPSPRAAAPIPVPAAPMPAPGGEAASPPMVAAPLPANKSLKAPQQEVAREIVQEGPKDVARQPVAQQEAGAAAAAPPQLVLPIHGTGGLGIIDVIIPFSIAGVAGISISLLIRKRVEAVTRKTESGER